jgi:hypothetical protein
MAFFLIKFDQYDTIFEKISVSKSLLFFLSSPFFSAVLAGKFCQELATLIHLQTGRRSTLDFAAVSASCSTSREINN